MNTITEPQIERLRKCRWHLIKGYPFFGYLALHLKLQKDETKTMPTAGVNMQGDLLYNEEYIATLPDDQLQTLLAHEACHLAFLTAIRLQHRDRKYWNIAHDFSINGILQQNNFQLNSDWLYSHNYTGMSGEQIYDEITKDKKDTQGNGFNGNKKNGTNDVIYGNADGQTQDGETPEEIQAKWKDRLAEAVAHAKQYGKMPAGIDRYYEDILHPKNNWRQQLYKFMSDNVKYDTTFNRPNRRFIASGIYLPSQLKENIEVVLAIDTSGSIDSKMLNDFYGELIGIRDSFNNIKITILTCDTKIHEVIEIGDNEKPEIKMKGGGGTDFQPVFEWIQENKPTCKVLIYLTDLCGTFPSNEPQYPTLWAIHHTYRSTYTPPFGEIVEIDDKENN